MSEPRGNADGDEAGAIPVDADPAVDEIFELMPEESPEEVMELADREESGPVTEEGVFEELAEELSTPSTAPDAGHSETSLDVPPVDELFGE